uniref:Retrovirus-related Pol polyprotein from transposon TNT 1-94-like beta-barrel domain-containing protein n=1 Tax=Lactuca sativa TaxID=4236 RepID=A0A9R1WS73_LACSA|nr:hypothetical protein LSAT_V11C900480370 [Lactuca sativa]
MGVVIDALEIMDYDMLDIINKGPIAVMYQSSNDDASNSELKKKYVLGYNKEEKRVLNFNVNARVAIINSLPYHVYCLVQNYSTAQEMMITLSSALEDLSDDEFSKGKCLMAQIVESQIDTSHDNVGTLDVVLSQLTKNLKSDWDSTSTYQCPVSNSEPGAQSKSYILDDSLISPEPCDKVSSEQPSMTFLGPKLGQDFLTQMIKGKEHIWYLDSDCLRHMTRFKSLLEDIIKKDGPIVTYGDNIKGATKGYGTIKCNSIIFKNVSYVEVLQHNLISISQICDVGYEVHFNKREGMVVNQKNVIVLTENRQNDIYGLDMFSVDNSLRCCFFSRAKSRLNWLWHKILHELQEHIKDLWESSCKRNS